MDEHRSSIPQVGMVPCGIYESLLFWSMPLMWKYSNCGGYLLNPPADKLGEFSLDFPPLSDMRQILRVVGLEEVKVDDALSKVSRG